MHADRSVPSFCLRLFISRDVEPHLRLLFDYIRKDFSLGFSEVLSLKFCSLKFWFLEQHILKLCHSPENLFQSQKCLMIPSEVINLKYIVTHTIDDLLYKV